MMKKYELCSLWILGGLAATLSAGPVPIAGVVGNGTSNSSSSSPARRKTGELPDDWLYSGARNFTDVMNSHRSGAILLNGQLPANSSDNLVPNRDIHANVSMEGNGVHNLENEKAAKPQTTAAQDAIMPLKPYSRGKWSYGKLVGDKGVTAPARDIIVSDKVYNSQNFLYRDSSSDDDEQMPVRDTRANLKNDQSVRGEDLTRFKDPIMVGYNSKQSSVHQVNSNSVNTVNALRASDVKDLNDQSSWSQFEPELPHQKDYYTRRSSISQADWDRRAQPNSVQTHGVEGRMPERTFADKGLTSSIASLTPNRNSYASNDGSNDGSNEQTDSGSSSELFRGERMRDANHDEENGDFEVTDSDGQDMESTRRGAVW